jgi:hypothetical protein
MLRGTRTQYLRRTYYFVVVAGFLSLNVLVFSLVLASTGWQRKGGAALLLLTDIFMLLLVIARLTDKHWYREQAELQRKASLRRGASISFPSNPATKRSLAFAKRLFGRRESD